MRRDERGSSTLETVIVTPAILLALMAVVQFGLVAHAKNVAEQAAQQGAAKARQFDGTESDAANAASAFLADVGGGRTLQNATVTPNRGQQTATVTVSGTTVNVLPGLDALAPGLLAVSETATGPVERYVPPVAQP